MKIEHCMLCHLREPIGFALDGSALIFSWTVTGAAGRSQRAARIQVYEAENGACLADSGMGDASGTGTKLAVPLRPRTRYYWTVTVLSDAGETAVSEKNRFETGKSSEPFAAKWITCADLRSHPVFTRRFGLEQVPRQARLYLTGLGLYEAWLNGRRVGDEFFTPYCNNYNAFVQVQTFDVTACLQAGQNELRVLLGKGWYSGRFAYDSKPGDAGRYGRNFALLAELRAISPDGKETVIGSDDSFSVQESKILDSSIYDGEIRDDTFLPHTAASAPLLRAEESARLTQKLQDRLSVPVRVVSELPVQAALTTPKNETVFDIGQEITGGFRFRSKEARGTVLRFQFGEVLQDGCFYRENLRTAKAEYRYVSDGREAVLTPHFTFYGYRYVKLERFSLDETGAEHPCTAPWHPEDFTALAIASDLPQTGFFATGHPLVNRLISNIRWGCRDNFLDVPTDCPQRDERLGWTGDTQVFAPSATDLFDTYAFYRKYLCDMATEQAARGGCVPFTVPSFGLSGGSAVWGDATTILPMGLYAYYGDDSIVREHYDAMKAWVGYILRVDGEDCGWRRAFHFGDWLALDMPGAEQDATAGATDPAFIADVYYMYSAELTAKAAGILEKTEDQAFFAALAERLRARIRRDFYTPSHRCAVDTQTALVLTLRHHLAPAEPTRQRLLAKIKQNGFHLDCGFVGAPLLAETLAQAGLPGEAVQLLLQEDCPGWLYEVKMGATTVWERWNSLDRAGKISSTGMNSLNHYAYGSVLHFLFSGVAGLSPLVPGFKKARIEPILARELSPVCCRQHTPAGEYEVCLERQPDAVWQISVTVPFDAQAELYLPGCAMQRLAAGTHTLRCTEPAAPGHLDIDTPLWDLQADEKAWRIVKTFFPGAAELSAGSMNLSLRQYVDRTGRADALQPALRRAAEALKQ